MTAARSDLMALAREAVAQYRGMGDKVIYSGEHAANILEHWLDRLAASQPDREAAQTLQRFADLFRSGAHGCDMGCDAAKSLALAIDSLLSGAGTKSDGGDSEEEHALGRAMAIQEGHPDPWATKSDGPGVRQQEEVARSHGESLQQGADTTNTLGTGIASRGEQRDVGNVANQPAVPGGALRTAPGPSDPSPGPDVMEVLRQLVGTAHGGAMLGGEAAYGACLTIEAKLNSLLSALTRPLGGFVLGSLRARARSIETAPREADEVLLISFQEQSDGSTYVSAHTGCWSEDIQMWVLGPRGSVCNSTGDGVSTHWIPLP